MSMRPTVVELMGQPAAVNAAASFARLLHVHRKGDVGSPRVSGSTSASRASRQSACHRRFGRPAPGRRMRPTGGPPRANSRRPLRTVTRAKPVAADTMASPPYPMANDSAAAHTRRLRSSNTGATAAYLATTTASSFRSRCTRTSRSDTEQRWNLYFGQCPKRFG